MFSYLIVFLTCFNNRFTLRFQRKVRKIRMKYSTTFQWVRYIYAHRGRCFSSCHERGTKRKLPTISLILFTKTGRCRYSSRRALCMKFVMGLAHLRVSDAQWYIEARKPKVWVSIPHGNSELFISPTLVTIWKTSFSISTELKTYHLSHNVNNLVPSGPFPRKNFCKLSK